MKIELMEAIRLRADNKFIESAKKAGRTVIIPNGGRIYSLADVEFIVTAAEEVYSEEACEACSWPDDGDCPAPQLKGFPKLWNCLAYFASLASEPAVDGKAR